MTVAYQEKFITLNGVRLRYLDWGAEGNTPLICMHGHAGQAHIWDEFAEAMSPHFHVYTLDQRDTAAAAGLSTATPAIDSS